MIDIALIDAQARERLVAEHDVTFFTEAGAGTGKTTSLVARIVALVERGLAMDRLVAITFTEAAAAELRDRVRSKLESAASEPQRTEEARALFRDAAATIDLASIQTIHAFCGALLRTYPLEAGLPPGFSTLDNIQQGLAFDERYRAWLFD